MHKRSESGQAIVLLALAVVGLVGFTALAIDTGMVYSDRRHSQSASDAGSLAGGGFIALALENYHIYYSNFDCSSSDIATITGGGITTAENRAYSNDYTNAEVTVTTVCEDNGAFPDDKYIDISTDIVSTTDTALIHLLYSGDAGNDVGLNCKDKTQAPIGTWKCRLWH